MLLSNGYFAFECFWSEYIWVNEWLFSRGLLIKDMKSDYQVHNLLLDT